MEEKRRVRIGLFVNSIQNDYSTLVCQGAAVAAEELDADLLIVPGRELVNTWDKREVKRFELQNNVLYTFINSSNIDVLIVSIGTVASSLNDKKRKEFLDQYRGVKIIALESEVEGYPSILYSMSGLRQEIEHFITVHGMRRIAYLSGPENNNVAQERVGVYRQVMSEHGLEIPDNYIAYGDFSDLCTDVVRNWFDEMADNFPEVICSANDTMVKCIKEVCAERGIRIGTDLFVAGFDNAAFTNVMVPPLTTVKSNVMTMGYTAVVSAVNYYKTGVFKNTSVDTMLITRQSCGCSPESVRETETKGISLAVEKEELIENIIKYTVKKSSLDIIPQRQIQVLRDFIGYVYERAAGKSSSSVPSSEMSKLVSELMSEENMEFFTFDAINAVAFALRKIALEGNPGAKREEVFRTFERFFRSVSLQFAEKSQNTESRMISDRLVFSRIADDMMSSGNDESESLRLLMNDIKQLCVKSCYLYLYNKSFDGLSKAASAEEDISVWKRPDYIYLKALYDDNASVFPDHDEQKMSYDEFLTNRFHQSKKRRTMVLQALYFNNEHYGIILMESSTIGLMSETMNISLQISTAIKLTQFMGQLTDALDNVEKANIKLSRESVTDQLTGIYNRRGFISESEKILSDRSGKACSGAVLYADLDCLKVINDTFGHREGDFAIRKASEILRTSLRKSDVVGRVGGDEFVAFIMDIDEERIMAVCRRITNMAAAFNKESDKPYNIGISMGLYRFNTIDGESIDQLMSGADRELYSNKKNKVKVVLKEKH
ncbi:GGDEF domain-containing protein [Ruminococcus sp. HUN007]|uniref:diguanylate cyclase n=1 Tax=Ruminococcus sp. HUN007 TaxID=1514668 RepID=UPI0005D1BF7D|nr:GGDEF domain-containing protein [Ruminococcus sp. HUN007]